MGLEAATHIASLNATNPIATDNVSQGDDHIRLLKTVLQATFPNADQAFYTSEDRTDVASAATTAIGGVASLFVNITGTTTITSFGTIGAGIWRFIRFNAALTLTHNATSLILPGGANITTAAGDTAIAFSRGSGNWTVIGYSNASALPIARGGTGATTAATAFTALKQAASETDTGVVEIATADEVRIGTDVNRVVTPNRLVGSGRGTLIGEIKMFSFSSVPTGYLECNGATISRATYAALFAVIADDYGPGDGSTTFKIPDYRGYFLRGWDHGATNDPDAGSRTNRGDGVVGDNVGTKQDSEFESHDHGLGENSKLNGTGGSFTYVDGGGADTNTDQAGGSETRPKNINIMFCIYTGI